jgi:RIO-like serine/threonine protein kinase
MTNPLPHLLEQLNQSIENNRTYKKKKIFLVGEEAIAKRNNKESAEHEYTLGSFLFEQGVQVPEMYMLVNPASQPLSHIKDWYVLMQKINGVEMTSITRGLEEKVIKQYRTELDKILGLGIYPVDIFWPENILFDPQTEKIHLIDLESWERGSAQQLNKFYQFLSCSDSELFRLITTTDQIDLLLSITYRTSHTSSARQ